MLRHNEQVPRTRMDELFALAEEHDGLLISKEARAAGIQDSVLVRLGQRGRLERMTRGVYRIRSIIDILLAAYRIDIARQSVSDAIREGLLNSAEASSFRRSITRTSSVPSRSTNGNQVKAQDAAAS